MLNPSFTKPFSTNTFHQGWGQANPPSYLKNGCPNEREILQGIRDTFKSLRNVKVVYIVFTCLPQQLLKREMVWGEIARFQPKIPVIQIATKFRIVNVTL